MAREFELPDVGEGIAEAEVIDWHVTDGDAVDEEQVLAEVETDKAVVDVPSPTDGVVLERKASEGDVVPVGEVIVVIDDETESWTEGSTDERDAVDDEDGPDGSIGTAPPDAPEHSSDTSESASDTTEPADSPEPTIDDGTDGASDGRTVFAPPSVRQLARELDVSIEAVEGSGASGRVTSRDVRAHADGIDVDDTGAAGAPTNGDGQSTHESGAQAAAVTTDTPADETRETTLATPEVRQLARDKGVDLDAVPASEQRDGEAFVTAEDVEAYARDESAMSTGDRSDEGGERARTGSGQREDSREPYTGVRRSIGERMAESKFTAPHVTHFEEIDVTELVDVRDRLAEDASDRGVTLTYTPFVLKACVAGLQEYPILNATLDEENEEIVKKGSYNIGVATDTDAGLMVPVVDDVDRKGILTLASETNELVAKARDRSISMEEMSGGTFTVSNTGAIGGQFGTPILNPPQSGILAIGSITKKPRVVTDEDGEESIVPRQVMMVSLSFDHRIVDGADAARFTNTVKEYLETPELLLL